MARPLRLRRRAGRRETGAARAGGQAVAGLARGLSGDAMSENDNSGTGDLERAAADGPLPGVEQADAAEEEGRDNSATPDSAGAGAGSATDDGDDDGDAPAGGVVMGAVNQH